MQILNKSTLKKMPTGLTNNVIQTTFFLFHPSWGLEMGVNGREVPVPVGQVWSSWVPTPHTFS